MGYRHVIDSQGGFFAISLSMGEGDWIINVIIYMCVHVSVRERACLEQ